MKTGRSLQDLAAEIERQNSAKRDFIADTRSTRVVASSGSDLSVGIGDKELARVLPTAQAQLHSWSKVPHVYGKRLLECAPEVYTQMMNHWLHNGPDNGGAGSRMFRTLDGNLRAFLSDSYRPLDNFDLCQAILPSIAEFGCRIVSCEVTDRRLYLKAVNERVQADIKVGDAVQAGVVISNSEIGHGSLQIAPMVYRLVCSNGMISQDNKLRKYHVGSKAKGEESVWELLEDETREKTDEALWMQIRDVTRSSLSEALFNQQVDKLREATEAKIEDPQKVPEVVELAAKRYGLNEDDSKGILGHLISGGDLSKYGLLNAVTRHSQDVEDYDKATELEELGGKILELNAREWAQLAS